MAGATTFTELAAEAQKQTIASLKHAQDISLRGAELAAGLVPDAPFAGKVPTPKDVVEGVFGFAGQILQQQKVYALRMTEIVAESATKAAPDKQK